MDKFDGMTAHERLFAAGLQDRFDTANASNDSKAINEVLAKVGL